MKILLIKRDNVLKFQSKRRFSQGKVNSKPIGSNFIVTTVKGDTGASQKLINFIEGYFSVDGDNYLTTASDEIYLGDLACGNFSSVLNLKRVNDIRYVNKFLESINEALPDSGLYIGTVETYPTRKEAILKKYPVFLNSAVYFLDYIVSRVFPKLPFIKKIYFGLTKGRGRVMSRAEMFGRLYSCGFEVVDENMIDGSLFFVARKVKQPIYDKNPTYAPLIGLNRIGKNGKRIRVYKLRTMHPYAEYLQEYVFKKNKLQHGGKMKDDFRISPEGRIFRKFWIDELPMLINLFKGELKLVGVRPLSEHYFSLYDKELQSLRVKMKPGLIPPFYVDMPSTLEEIMLSEIKYIRAYQKRPYYTDFVYLFKSLYNILIKRERSS